MKRIKCAISARNCTVTKSDKCTWKTGTEVSFCWDCRLPWRPDFKGCGNTKCDGGAAKLTELMECSTKTIGSVSWCPKTRAGPIRCRVNFASTWRASVAAIPASSVWSFSIQIAGGRVAVIATRLPWLHDNIFFPTNFNNTAYNVIQLHLTWSTSDITGSISELTELFLNNTVLPPIKRILHISFSHLPCKNQVIICRLSSACNASVR